MDGKGVVQYKVDRWTGKTWAEISLITSEGLVVSEKLASPSPAEGEEWAKTERNLLTAVWIDLFILCLAWLLVTLKRWLPQLDANVGRKAIIIATICFIAGNGTLFYAWMRYSREEQANLALIKAHQIWEETYKKEYDRLYPDLYQKALEGVDIRESEEPISFNEPFGLSGFQTVVTTVKLYEIPKLYPAISPGLFAQSDASREASKRASKIADEYTQSVTGISGVGNFDADYINSVITDIRNTKTRILYTVLHFSVTYIAFIIVVRAITKREEKENLAGT